jgi:Protein of unknown function (DUF4232)
MTPPDSPARSVLGGLLLAAAAVLAAACASSGTGSPATTVTVTPSPTGTGPATSPATSPTSASSSQPQAARCTTAGLHISKGATNGAAGTIFYNIDFTNASSTACVLEGYPGVSLVSAGSEAGSQVGADARRTTTTPVHPVTIAGGQTAHAVLGVAEAGNFPAAKCDPVTAHWLKVFPPDQRAAAYVSFTTQTCASTAQPTMTIAAITGGP